MRKMVGLRAAAIAALLGGGVVLFVGQERNPGPDGSVMSRLQILMGRPAPRVRVEPRLPPQPAPAPVAPQPSPPEFPVAAAPPVEPPTTAPPPQPEPEVAPDLRPLVAAVRTTSATNLRSGPSLEERRVLVARSGQSLPVTGRTLDGEWYRVSRDEGDAYVSASVVEPDWVETARGRISRLNLTERMDELAQTLRRARFQEVVREAPGLRLDLRRFGHAFPIEDALVIRLELMTATAQVALGQNDEAAVSLERVLELDDGLELDPLRSPPKLRRLLASVRQGR